VTVEVAQYISQLSPTLPPGSDLESEGDNHLRLLKSVLQQTFPNATKMFNLIVTNQTVGNYTVVYPTDMNSLQIIDATAGGRTVTLPNPSSPVNVHSDGWKMWVVKKDSTNNTVTINGGGNLINGQSSLILSYQNQIIELQWSNAVNAWFAADSMFGLPPVAIAPAAPYTVLYSDMERLIEFDTSVGSKVVNLPTTFLGNFRATIFKTDSTVNPLTLTPTSGTINGLASISLYGPGDSAIVFWNGATWRALLLRQDDMPVGMTGNTLLEAAPSNKWLPLNGVNFDRTLYAPLFTAWSTSFGSGNGTTTAGMPDVRGYFPRFWNNAAGNDPDAASRTNRGDGTTGDHTGTKQDHAVGAHTHTTTLVGDGTSRHGSGGVNVGTLLLGADGDSSSTGVAFSKTFTSGAVNGGNFTTENRPKNIYLAGYVKALP
jgi:microcystin-dependent protein